MKGIREPAQSLATGAICTPDTIPMSRLRP